MKLNNKYYILRHGEAVSNVKNIVSCLPEKFKNPLTKLGKEMIKERAKNLSDKNIDLIFVSPLLRANQTAEIVGKALGIKPKIDKRLREIEFGVFNGKPVENFVRSFKNVEDRTKENPIGGENYTEVLKRMMSFLNDVDKKYKRNPPSHKASEGRRNILIVSHQCPLFLLEGYVKDFSLLETIKNIPEEKMLRKGEIRELYPVK